MITDEIIETIEQELKKQKLELINHDCISENEVHNAVFEGDVILDLSDLYPCILDESGNIKWHFRSMQYNLIKEIIKIKVEIEKEKEFAKHKVLAKHMDIKDILKSRWKTIEELNEQ